MTFGFSRKDHQRFLKDISKRDIRDRIGIKAGYTEDVLLLSLENCCRLGAVCRPHCR